VKQQGYYYYLDEMYGLHVVSSKTLQDLETSWKNEVSELIHHHGDSVMAPPTQVLKKERPPLMLEPMFVILAGAAAAVVRAVIV
jgi:hypothetical protein